MCPQYAHIDEPSGYFWYWMFYYTLNSAMYAPQYVHADVPWGYFCYWTFFYTHHSNMDVSRTPGSILFVASETSFQLFSRRDLHLPRVLRPNKLMGLVKGEGRRGCCLHVKVAVGFKVLLIKFSSGNHRLLGVLCKEQSGTGIQETSLQQCNSGTWCSERAGRWKWWEAATQTTFQGSRQALTQVAR